MQDWELLIFLNYCVTGHSACNTMVSVDYPQNSTKPTGKTDGRQPGNPTNGWSKTHEQQLSTSKCHFTGETSQPASIPRRKSLRRNSGRELTERSNRGRTERGKKPMLRISSKQKDGSNLCWLNRPAFSVLRKELPEELLNRFYYNILKED